VYLEYWEAVLTFGQAKPTHENIIRLAPPLVISEEQIKECLRIIGEAIIELPDLKGKQEDDVIPKSEKGVHIGLDI
jgi:ornithine--oxo-acid transaminase